MRRSREKPMTEDEHARRSAAAKKCKTPELRARLAEATRQYFKTHDHPMKGKHASPEARANMSKSQKKRAESETKEEKVAHDAQLAKARKNRKYTLEHMIRYVLNRAGTDYEPQVNLEWAPGQTIYVDVFVQPNIVIEAYGDAWHGNPEKYKSDDLLPSGITAGEKWVMDAARRDGLERRGYKVIVVWESRLRRQTADEMKRVLDACGASVPDTLNGYGQLAAEAESHLRELESELKRKWYHKKKDLINERIRERRKNDDEYREQQNEKARKRLDDDPELRARQNQARNDKYHNDAAFRAKTKAKSRELYHTDPAHRAKTKARSRKRYREKKDEIRVQSKARYAKNREKILGDERKKYARDLEYAERKRSQSREYGRKNRDSVMNRKREYYKLNRDDISSKRKKKKPMDAAKIIAFLGSVCCKCGERATVARHDPEMCKNTSHATRRWYSGYYANKPAEARRFLLPFCVACHKAAKTETARKAHTGKKASKETRAKMSESGRNAWKARRSPPEKAQPH